MKKAYLQYYLYKPNSPFSEG